MNRDPLQQRSIGAADANKALAASIVGLLLFAPAAIYSVLLAGQARSEAEQTSRPLDGKMQAAWIISIVALVVWAIGILIVLILVVSGEGDLNGPATLFAGVSLSIAACMVHAAANQRWKALQGGGLLLAVFLVFMIGASVR
jgi:hypothetical protein